MRFIAIIGFVVLGLLGASLVLNWHNARPTASVLDALEETLERPLVIHLDGQAPADFDADLVAIDEGTGALAVDAAPRTLIDLDTYVMVRDSWDTFRAIDGHDLTALIHEKTADKTATNSITWFDTMLTSDDGTKRRVLLILTTDEGVADLGDFCFALTVYELARFAQNGDAFKNALDGPGSYWMQCRSKKWRSVADLPAAN
ncbi:hypothetical protein [Tateyamaria sp.]|uniref:hypothetical protein n=1 Tax=Tateyamaria sp. TaxID=1929288 RepID=UPI00329D077D